MSAKRTRQTSPRRGDRPHSAQVKTLGDGFRLPLLQRQDLLCETPDQSPFLEANSEGSEKVGASQQKNGMLCERRTKAEARPPRLHNSIRVVLEERDAPADGTVVVQTRN
jgi:hypothetical protein